MTDLTLIEVIIPALNEAGAIGRVVRGMLSHGATRVIVADNGSTDETARFAAEAGATVVHEPIRGYGRACLAGFTSLQYDGIVVIADGDACDDPRDLPRLLAPIREGVADMVLGSRLAGFAEAGALPLHSLFGNWLAVQGMRLCFGQRVTDMGPFRAIRREALRQLHMAEPNFGWNVEMQAKAALARLRVIEIPVRYRKRSTGTSKITGSMRKSIEAGVIIIGAILKYRFLGRRSLQPKSPRPIDAA